MEWYGYLIPPLAKVEYADTMSTNKTSPPPRTRDGPYKEAGPKVQVNTQNNYGDNLSSLIDKLVKG